MILTSYFSNWRKFPDKRQVSIARHPPKGFKGEQFHLLAPWDWLLWGYKNGKITQDEYREIYREQLEFLNVDLVYNELKGAIILCYETPEDFCHRQIVREWFTEHGYNNAELGFLKVGVVGSRTFNDYDKLEKVLEKLDLKFGISTIVSGGAKGADFLGEQYAEKHGKEKEIFLPDWEKFGKSAGFIRNKDIVENSHILVAFWDGKSKGTKHSIELAEKMNKAKIIINF